MDPNLAAKIAKLKQGRQTAAQKAEAAFAEVGVELPLGYEQAIDRVADLLERAGVDEIELRGTSMGFDGSEPSLDDKAMLRRVWTALRTRHSATSFTCTLEPGTFLGARISPLPPRPVPHDDPSDYPTGTVLCVEKNDARQYIRVGGLFDDTQLTILETMKPMTEVSGWAVVEVVSDGST